MELIHRAKGLFYTLIRHIIELNLFKSQSTDPIIIRRQINTTRLFLILFGISFLILLSYTAISKQTTIETVQKPNSATFKKLEKKYSSSLSCSCTQISIPYGLFVETKPSLHQVCSSDFVGQSWIDFIFEPNFKNIWPMDVRTSLSAMWQIIASLCRNANNTISDMMKEFANEPLISSTAFSKTYLEASVHAALENAQQTAIDRFTRDLTVIDTVVQINNYMTGIGTNFFGTLQFGDTNVPYYALILEGKYQLPGRNDTCYCHRTQSCRTPAGLYSSRDTNPFMIEINLNEISPYIIFPGIVFDCLPSLVAFGSSLECFYSLSCINSILMAYEGTINISSLNANITSRFPTTMVLKQITEQLFLEQIVNTTSFNSYYEGCAPISCTYTYSRRFDLIFIITTLAGLLGGLYTMLRFISPFLILGMSFLKRKLLRQTIQTQSGDNIQMQFQWRNILKKIKTALVELNFYVDGRRQDPSVIHRGRIATRVHVVLVIVTMLILIFYTYGSNQINTVIVKSPSQEQYEMLHMLYPNTLQCPCTIVSIPQQQFIQIIPFYHQICSSDFVQPWWYQSLLYLLIAHYYVEFSEYSSSYFQALAFFCNMTKQTFAPAYNQFSLAKFVNAQVLPRSTFTSKTNTLIETFLETTQAELFYTVMLVSNILRADQYASALVTNTVFDVIDLNPFSDQIPYLVYSSFQKYNRDSDYVCSCATDPDCTALTNYTGGTDLPQGISGRCQIVDTTLQSSLTCWYDDQCFGPVLQRLRVLSGQPSLNITLLNPNQSRRFQRNATLEIILNEMMVEYFNSSASYNSYYQQCYPASCTYTLQMRNDLIYIVTTVIGLVGGINIILYLLCPLIAKLFLRLSRTAETNTSFTISTQRPLNDRMHKQWSRFRNKLFKYNMFASGSEQIDVIRREIISTRIYFLFLSTAFAIITIYTMVPTNIVNKKIDLPSLSQHNDLLTQYSATLHCPCNQNSIFYRTFVTSNRTYHQVCSSDFVNESWILFLTTDNYSSILSRNSFQASAGAYFRLLSTLCTLAQNATEKAMNEFLAKTFLSADAMSESQFLSQMTDVTDQFQRSVAHRFSHTIQLLRDFVQSNALVSSYNLNWYLWLDQAQYMARVFNAPVIVNDQCSCGTRSDCIDPTPFSSLMPGWVLGCSISETLLRSNLEILYNQTSIDYLETYLTMSDPDNYPTRVYATAMNDSVISRFESNTSIQHIVDSVFIEEWFMNASFSLFYQECAPLYCLYTVNERNNVLYVVSRILGLYGGLTVTLRFIVPYLIRLLFKLKAYLCVNRITPLH